MNVSLWCLDGNCVSQTLDWLIIKFQSSQCQIKCYADDTHIYISISPEDFASSYSAISARLCKICWTKWTKTRDYFWRIKSRKKQIWLRMYFVWLYGEMIKNDHPASYRLLQGIYPIPRLTYTSKNPWNIFTSWEILVFFLCCVFLFYCGVQVQTRTLQSCGAELSRLIPHLDLSYCSPASSGSPLSSTNTWSDCC